MFARLKAFLRNLKTKLSLGTTKWIWVSVIGLVSAFAWFFTRRSPRKIVKEEIKYFNVQTQIQQMLADKRYHEAVSHAKSSYADKMAHLDQEERLIVEHLEADPENLASYLASIHL